MKLFDLDGTLIDSNGVWLQIDVDFLNRRGLPYTDEYRATIAHCIFPTAAAYTKEYFGLNESTDAIMEEWRDMAREAYAGTIPLKPGVRAFLDQERERGEKMSVVTACVPEFCHSVLARHGLKKYFSTVLFAQELGMEKRNPTFFGRTLSILGELADRCVLYEDAPENCAAAKDAGIAVVGVYDKFFAAEEARMRELCDDYIHSFDELL